MDISPFEWFKIAATIGAFIGASAVWLWGRDRATAIASAVEEQGLAFVHRRIDDDRAHVHQRFEQGNALVSKLSSYVQELPTRHEYDERQKRVAALEGQ